MSIQDATRHDQVLMGLVFSLQAGAMQQLGKIQNPMTGEIQKDLDQAKATIDVLEMLKVKCRVDTPEDILKMIDSAVMDLQLNYMDEVKKAQEASAKDSKAPAEEASSEAEPSEAEPAEAAVAPEKTSGSEADG